MEMDKLEKRDRERASRYGAGLRSVRHIAAPMPDGPRIEEAGAAEDEDEDSD